MKKLLFFLLFVTSASMVKAQDFNKVLLAYSTKKYEEAKTEVDKLAADSKASDKPETYLWKLAVYAELYGDSTLGTKYPDAGKEAWNALTKYAEKDPQLTKLKDNSGENGNGLRAVSLLYGQSFNYGRSAFQNKDWNGSFDYFSFCQNVSEFIGKNGLNTSGKYTIDTTIVLYAGYAAQNAGKQDEAVARYKALADWKVGVKDTSFKDVYKSLLYMEQKNDTSFKKYLAIAKEVYPEDMALWNQYEMSNMTSNASLKDILAKYKADDASGKLKEADYVTYAETFAQPDKNQLAQLDSTQQQEVKLAAADAFIKAYNLNDTNGLYAFNAGVLYYSTFGQLDDQYYNLRGESAALKAQREAVVKQQQDISAKAIEWLEKGYNALKAKPNREKNESASLNRAVDYLANLYLWKRDKSRGTNAKDYDAFDAKYKLFDSEHDKYKQQ
jgi:hypothetical protein